MQGQRVRGAEAAARARSPSPARPAAAAAAVLLGLALGAAALAQQHQEPSKPLRLLGRVVELAPDRSSLELRTARGTYTVELPPQAEIAEHRTQPMAACPGGSRIHVLARRQPATTDPQTGRTIPEHVSGVQAVVIGEGFEPPAVPERLRAGGLQWISGTLVNQGGKAFAIDETLLQIGPERPVVVLERAERTRVARQLTVQVLAQPLGAEQPRRVLARQLVLLSRRVPAAEYALILGSDH